MFLQSVFIISLIIDFYLLKFTVHPFQEEHEKFMRILLLVTFKLQFVLSHCNLIIITIEEMMLTR